MTALHVAAKKGECRKMVKYLIDKADIDIKDYNGVSKMDWCNRECCIYLLFEILQALMWMSPT